MQSRTSAKNPIAHNGRFDGEAKSENALFDEVTTGPKSNNTISHERLGHSDSNNKEEMYEFCSILASNFLKLLVYQMAFL